MKIIDESEHGGGMRINSSLCSNPGIAGQRQADDDQQCNECTNTVKEPLHDLTIGIRGGGLFHSTMPG